MKDTRLKIKEWRTIDHVLVKPGSIKRSPEFQPRKTELACYRDRSRLEVASNAHIEHLTAQLAADPIELEPVLLARIEGKLWLIDGHHRYLAYRRANRHQIPARIMEADRETAVAVSKLANCDGVKLQMHPDQLKEAAWQFLAYHTQRGKKALPSELSLRAIGRLFGVSSSTMSRMHTHLRTIKPDEFNQAALDPGTDFPLWKYVKGNAIRDRLKDIPEDKLLAQLASKISTLIEKHSISSILSAVKLLEEEALIAAIEDLAVVSNDGDELTDF